MEDKSLNKKKYLLIVSIFSTIIILLGSAYAFFSYFKTASAFTLRSNSITATFTEGTNQISFTNAYPISDEYALQNLDKLDYIDFTVSGSATNEQEAVTYEIFLTENTNNTLDKNYIKTYVTDNNGAKITNPTMYGSLPLTTYSNEPTGRVVLQKTYAGTFTKSYRLYIWLDSTYEQNTVSQTFSFYVNIYAYNNIQENAINRKYSSQQLIEKIKTTNLKTDNNTPLNYVTETDNGEKITYLSGCSKYYLDQGASGCTQDNTIDFNYVWYSGRMWRITSFNETTNTIKLITEQSQTAIAWHEDTNNGGSTAFEGSYMKQFLNDEFYDSLYNPTSFIDTSVLWDITTTTSPSTKLSNPTLTSNVGLLNSYEYFQSYQKLGSYSYGYLNIGQYWWLLNPYSASVVWCVNSGGGPHLAPPTITYAVRPSINLKSSVNFTGSGTESDPYKLVGDKEIGITNTKLNTRTIGEYVKLKNGDNEQVFRIVGFEGTEGSESTKLIQLDYVRGNDNVLITKKFATSNSNGDGTIFGEGNTMDDTNNTTWYSYLKNVYIGNLETTYGSNLFTTGEYYLGINAENPSDGQTNYNYRTSICDSGSNLTKNCPKSKSISLKAGLLRYGEMFATQHGIGYNTKASSYNTAIMWLMTRRTALRVWDVYDNGGADNNTPTFTIAGRPSVNLSSGVRILSGSGTELDPYVVGL